MFSLSKSRCASRLVLSGLVLAGLGFALPASADDCDYSGRHYKTDIMPTGGLSYPASVSGEIVISPSIALDVQNVGTNPVSDNSDPGSIVRARRLAVTVKGQTFYAYLPTPLEPGETARVSFSVPEGFLSQCELATFAIDSDAQIGQWGCEVRANDTITFRTRFGARHCVADAVRPLPPIFRSAPALDGDEAEGLEIDQAVDEVGDGQDLQLLEDLED